MPGLRSIPFKLLLFACLLIIKASFVQARIVAFGASNVSGWNVAAAETFSARLQTMLSAQGYRVTILNAGVYGNTTADMLNRVDSDIPPDTAIVILDVSGGFYNNLTHGVSREQGEADMAAIETKLKARGVRIITESTADLPAEYRQPDGRHLNPEGHKFVASRLLPEVMEALGPPAQTVSEDVRNACRADARRLCADVLGDDDKRHACMHEHKADLSKDCLTAIARSKQSR
ncbi:MAG: GDSL-type esterase/lipase family protein [Methylomonas sp.]|jgi:acyl-CoA thioesterase-1